MNENEKRVEEILKTHANPRVIMPSIGVDGFAMEFTLKGEHTRIIQKGSFTSLDPIFYTYVKNITSLIGGKACWRLLIRSNEKETKIFEDNFPVTMLIRAKGNVKKLQPIYKSDIADITQLSFQDDISDVNPVKGEKVICILSEGYLHGLYFDFTGELEPEIFKTEIGYLYRRLQYYHIYDAISDGTIQNMISIGWFPFVQLVGNECQQLISLIKGNKLDKVPIWLNQEFTNERISNFTSRWITYSAYQKKPAQIKQGIECFLNDQFVASISILTPLIEGVFNSYLLEKTGKGISYKGEAISDSIHKAANTRADGLSLLLPNQFKEYLDTYFFRNEKSSTSTEATRHAVGHGRAEDDAFTRERALQIILTLDQLFFYMDK